MQKIARQQRKSGGKTLSMHRFYYFSSLHLIALLGFYYYTAASILSFFVFYLITGLGITVGFHRLLTHRSFKTPSFMLNILATAGSLAAQGGPLFWVSVHRLHHQCSDQDGDPHDSRLGFFWSHIGWILFSEKILLADPKPLQHLAGHTWLRWLDRHFLLLQLLLVVILFAVTYAIAGEYDAIAMIVWAVPIRIIAVLHSTWLTNSAAHLWGYRSFDTDDHSRNCWWVALLTLGEGWHNNHHAYPFSARHGLKFWELDLSWWFICGLQRIGMAWDVKLPPASEQKN